MWTLDSETRLCGAQDAPDLFKALDLRQANAGGVGDVHGSVSDELHGQLNSLSNQETRNNSK